ncbi:MAG: PHP domain-containing protein, partial [Proteobacteria bacterium]
MKHPKNFELPLKPRSEKPLDISSQPDETCDTFEAAEIPDPSAMGSHRGPVPHLEQKLMYVASSRGPARALKEFRPPAHKLAGDAYEEAFDDLVALNKRPEFIELLAQTNFSFLQGGSHPEEMVMRAKKAGYKGLGICDVNGLYGVVRGYQAAEKPSVFDAEQLMYTDELGQPKNDFQYLLGSILTPYDSSPVSLIPTNKEGYVRLSHLITKAKRKAPKGQIILSLKDVCDQPDDLIACPLPPWNTEQILKMKDAFGDRLYLPVHKDFTWESVRTYKQALHYEAEFGIQLFATQRPLYHDPSRKPLHDVLTCILHKTTLREAATRLTLNRERYIKTPEQIAFLFRERPDLVARTLEIAKRVKFSLTELRYRYPQENLPKGKTAPEYLRELVEKGVQWRYGEQIARAKSLPSGPEKQKEAAFLRKVKKQVEDELELIAKLEYEDYFITLKEICVFATEKNILHQGRGSAANSVVCYTLGLTSVDPVKLGLLFGRFLSEERAEPPDIDIDFEHERR